MAAPTDEQVGIEFLLKAGASDLGCSTSATRTRTTSMVDTSCKDGNRWMSQLPSTQEEAIEFDKFWLDSDNQATALGMNFSVESNPILGINTVTLSVTQELIDVINNDTARWRELRPSTRSVELSIERDYIDPASDPAVDALLNAKDTGTTAAVDFSLQSFSFTGDVYVPEESLETPYDDLANGPLELVLDSEPSTFSYTSQGAALVEMLDALTATPGQSLTALVQVVDASQTQVTDATSYSIETYPETVEFEFPVEDPVTVSGTLQSTGPETRAQQT